MIINVLNYCCESDNSNDDLYLRVIEIHFVRRVNEARIYDFFDKNSFCNIEKVRRIKRRDC